MKILLARKSINEKPKSTTLESIEEELQDSDKIYYFDKDNSHKNMMTLVKHFENKNRSVYFQEIKYGLDDSEYLYEVHIV
jgi:lipopolysaccharide export LptBFGC system permease protein LptF